MLILIQVHPLVLAEAGFFYTGQDDRVRCAFCNGSLQDWQSGDQPVEEHAKHFPTCSMERETQSHGAISENRLDVFIVSGRENCGDSPYSVSIYDDSPYGDSRYSVFPYDDSPYGDSPYGDSPYGVSIYDDSPYGDSPYGVPITFIPITVIPLTVFTVTLPHIAVVGVWTSSLITTTCCC